MPPGASRLSPLPDHRPRATVEVHLQRLARMSSSSRSSASPPSPSADLPGRSVAPVAQLITMSTLLETVPFSRQHILRLEKRGRFPRRIRLGDNRVAWLRSEIEAWIASRVAERDDGKW